MKNLNSKLRSIELLGLVAVAICLVGRSTHAGSVLNNNDGGPGSLRQAIFDSGNNEVITFNPGVTGTIVLTNQLHIWTNLTIQGPGAKSLTIDANLQSRVFYIHSDLTNVSISGLTLTRGWVADGTNALGGAIFNEGNLNLQSCHLTGNYSVGNDMISGTGGNASGGGIYTTGTLALTACTLDANQAYAGNGLRGGAAQGGGIYKLSGSLALTNCTMSLGNNAIGGHSTGSFDGGGAAGGGILNLLGPCVLVNCTIRLNAAAGGISDQQVGGLGVGSGLCTLDNLTPAKVLNTVIADNLGGHGQALIPLGGPSFRDSYGMVTSLGHNLVGDVAEWVWDATDLVLFPPFVGFGPLGDYGGDTPTMPIAPSSVAHDGGDDNVLFAPYSLTSDQRGYHRPWDKHVDIGAYEFDPNHPWLSLNPGSWNSGGGGRWDFLSNWQGGFPGPGASVLISNANSKTITIDSFNPTNTLSISNLLVSAPSNTVNTLLLDNAGLGNPLRIHENLFLFGGGALTVNGSAIEMTSGRPPSAGSTNGGYNGSSVIFDGPVSFNNSSLSFSNAFDTAVGTVAAGYLNMTNSIFNAYDLIVSCGAAGTANFVNCTSVLSGSLLLATSSGQTGRVSIVGGQFTAVNPATNTPALVLDRGNGQLTVSGNATVQFGDTIIGNFGQGSALTLQSGTMTLGTTYLGMNGNFLAASNNPPPASGSLTIAGGRITIPELHVGYQGTGAVNLTGGFLSNSVVSLADAYGASGSLTITGGTNVIGSKLTVAAGLHSTGKVTIDGGTLIATNGITLIGPAGTADLILSGGEASFGQLGLGAGVAFDQTLDFVKETDRFTDDRFTDFGSHSVASRNGILFYGDPGGFGTLWRSDGTANGTTMVKSFVSGVDWLLNANGVLFVGSGDEIWKSDGSEVGTIKVTTRPKTSEC